MTRYSTTIITAGRSGVDLLPPIPVTLGSIIRGNEPSGMSIIADQPFSLMPSNGWQMQGGAALTNDSTGPQSPGSVMAVPWSAGVFGGVSAGSAFKTVTGTINTLYMAAWVKFSSNWQGANNSANRIGNAFIAGANRVGFTAFGTGAGPLLVNVSLQNTVNLGGSSNWQSALAFNRGSWDYLEVIMKSNTAGNADGQVDMFINGASAVSRPGIQWTTVTSGFTDQLSLDPIWGGIADQVVNSMDIRFDHCYLSGKP